MPSPANDGNINAANQREVRTMTELIITKEENGILTTDKGIFHVVDDCVISDATGEAFTVAGSTTDENGNLSQLMIE